jgi:pyruvate/2-oxoglutarate dehydrogenase complex dihydrolipoamide acyltransferase (E2) component
MKDLLECVMEKAIVLQNLGDEVEEAEISQWLVKEGDDVEVDTPIVEVLVDKVSVELTAEFKGKIKKILIEDGSIVKIGEDIAIMEV